MSRNSIPETEIRQAWIDYAADPRESIRNRLAERYLPIVHHQAKRLMRRLPPTVIADDLASAGVFGLLAAIDAFDPGRGIRFESYCVPRIRGSMLDELRRVDWVPRLVRSRCEKPVEVLSMHGRSEKRGPLGGDRRAMESAVYEDRRIPSPCESSQRADVMRMVTRGLSRTERRVVQLYYGDALTMKQVAGVLGCNESYVSQIHARVMRELRERLDGRQSEFVA